LPKDSPDIITISLQPEEPMVKTSYRVSRFVPPSNAKVRSKNEVRPEDSMRLYCINAGPNNLTKKTKELFSSYSKAAINSRPSAQNIKLFTNTKMQKLIYFMNTVSLEDEEVIIIFASYLDLILLVTDIAGFDNVTFAFESRKTPFLISS
jgi:hypothetical protein